MKKNYAFQRNLKFTTKSMPRNIHRTSSSTGALLFLVFKALQQAHSSLCNCFYITLRHGWCVIEQLRSSCREDEQNNKSVAEVISCTFLGLLAGLILFNSPALLARPQLLDPIIKDYTPIGIVYSRVPRTTGQHQVKLQDGSNYTLHSPDMWDRLPDSRHKYNGFNAPGQLIYQAADGSERILYDCFNSAKTKKPCVPLDPSVSFDGKKILFSVYRGTKLKNAWWDRTTLPNKQLSGEIEAQLYIVEISSGKLTPLKHTRGVRDVSPVWLQDGRIMFASDRAKTRQPWIYRLTPTGSQPQLYISDIDGSNAINISPHELATAMHPYVLNSGRVAYSSMWLSHNLAFAHTNGGINFFTTVDNMWVISDIDYLGGDSTTLLGAHRKHSIRDSISRRTKTFKALHFMGQRHNNDICTTNYYRGNNLGLGDIFCWPPELKGIEGRRGTFLPYQIYNVATWSVSNDQRSFDIKGVYQGKIAYPEGIADNQLMLTLGRGYCAVVSGTVVSFQNDVAGQPEKRACDTGIYRTTQIPSYSIKDLQLVVDHPQWHEFGARAVVPRSVEKPKLNIVKGNICTLASSDAGSGETHPHFKYKFNNNYKASANHGGMIDGLSLVDLHGIKFWKVLPNKGPRPKDYKSSVGNKLKYLGEVSLLDDKSFIAELPCDTPYIMAGTDINGNVITRDQLPQSLRPGESRTCQGCHLHSRPGRPFPDSMAFKATPKKLTSAIPVPSFKRDIRPILKKHCASCHVKTAGGLNDVPVLNYDHLVWDFFQHKVPDAKRIRFSTTSNRNRDFGLQRPYTSKYVNNMFARESLLYWKAANKRLDGRDDSTYPDDIDFGEDHPSSISQEELKTIGHWLDSGAES